MSCKRSGGVLLHISSLPGAFGVGDFGPAALKFADFLHDAGFSVWQTLPLTPVSSAFGDSPYSSPSAFAGNMLCISPELLFQDGFVSAEEMARFTVKNSGTADFEAAHAARSELLGIAWRNFCACPQRFATLQDDFTRFLAVQNSWLADYALFAALKHHFAGRCWNEWPDEYKFRDEEALQIFALKQENAEYISFVSFCQYIFSRQLAGLRSGCRSRGVSLFGDMPMFVALDSPDVWAHRDLFDLDGDCRPNFVAGVPPDYFSSTGQRWGNPLYRWDVMEHDGFSWWLARMQRAFDMFDFVRIDHFRGFCGYWAIPADEPTAVKGCWRPAPGGALMKRFAEKFCAPEGELPLVAEDLGIITDDVRNLMEEFCLPGMKVLQFAFGDGVGSNPYAPHNIVKNAVVYTGTHDNNTTLGWWRDEATEADKRRFCLYAGCEKDEVQAAAQMARLALASSACLAVLPMQDLLNLDSSCRMNKPGTPAGNWRWRLADGELAQAAAAAEKFKELNVLFGRYA